MKPYVIDLREIEFTATRSSGPGGQNVNKVSSSAILNWSFEFSANLDEEQKFLIRTKLQNYINKEGVLYLRSDEFRDLDRNKSRCLEKLNLLIKKAFFKAKVRKKTRPTFSSQIKRLDGKKNRGEIKKNRKRIEKE